MAVQRYDCALITGASAGLGEEFARQLGPRCRRIVLVARREERLKHLETRLRIDNPELQVASLALDLTREQDRTELIDRLEGSQWAPTLLINNAGMGDYGEFVTSDWTKVRQMLDVNISALTHLCHGLLPDMIRRRKGAILNVSSLASLLPIPDFGVYAATKAFVTSFSEALRLELREYGIPVLALCPGPVHTEFGAIAGREGEPAEAPGREWFYVSREQVVYEGLMALERDQARSFPGWQVALVAAGLTLLPMLAIRALMSQRPRSIPTEPSGLGERNPNPAV